MLTRRNSLHALAPLLLSFSTANTAATLTDKQEIAASLPVCQKAQEAECGHVPHLEHACDEAVKAAMGLQTPANHRSNAQKAESPH